MSGGYLGRLLLLMLCSGTVMQCPAPTSRAPGRQVKPAPPAARMTAVRVKPPRVAHKRPAVKIQPAAWVRSCRRLLGRYEREVAGYPYPANVPYMPLLNISRQIVKRYSRPAEQARCVSLVRRTMSSLFGRTIPGDVPPVKVKSVNRRMR